MAEAYVKFTLTEQGEAIMARVIAGLEITFKRIAIGDGYDYDTENFKSRTELVNEVKSLDNLTMQIVGDNQVELSAKFGKTDITSSFWYREIGIYIIDPDNSEEEILYGYGNMNNEAQYITPDIANYGVLKNIKAYVKVGNSANVNIYITTSQTTTEISFAQSDWTLDSGSGLYTLPLGAVREVIKVFKTTENGRIDTALVDIIHSTSGITTLRSLIGFDGSVISI